MPWVWTSSRTWLATARSSLRIWTQSSVLVATRTTRSDDDAPARAVGVDDGRRVVAVLAVRRWPVRRSRTRGAAAAARAARCPAAARRRPLTVACLRRPVLAGADRERREAAVGVRRVPAVARVGAVPGRRDGHRQRALGVLDGALGRRELALGGVPGSPADGQREEPDHREHREPPPAPPRQRRLGQVARVGLHGGARTGLGQLGVAVEPRLGRRPGGDRAERRCQGVDELGDGRVAVVAAAGQPAVQHLRRRPAGTAAPVSRPVAACPGSSRRTARCG